MGMKPPATTCTASPGRRQRVGTAASVAVAVVCGLAGASSAAAAWTSPFEVFAPRAGYAFEPQVAVDATGDAVLAWVADGHVVARTRSAETGALGPVLAFGGPGAHFARVVVSADGRATVVWLRDDGAVSRVLARRLSATGTPGPAVRGGAPGPGGGALGGWPGGGRRGRPRPPPRFVCEGHAGADRARERAGPAGASTAPAGG